jgi:hypothetical protein
MATYKEFWKPGREREVGRCDDEAMRLVDPCNIEEGIVKGMGNMTRKIINVKLVV